MRPLLFGWYLTTLLGLGGTTPAGKMLLGRAYQVLTFERFTFWATLMAMPFVGLLAVELLQRFRLKAVVGAGDCCRGDLATGGCAGSHSSHQQLAVQCRSGDRLPESR